MHLQESVVAGRAVVIFGSEAPVRESLQVAEVGTGSPVFVERSAGSLHKARDRSR